MNVAYIGLGSNLGDSRKILVEAWKALGNIPGIQPGLLSHPYRTEPVGMTSENWFVNAAGTVTTTLAPLEFLEQLHRVEREFGRLRNSSQKGYQDRTLDLDLLLYEQIVLDDGEVHVPHPFLQERLFVLAPLCEIAPDLIHPVLKKNVQELLTLLKRTKENPTVEMIEWDKDD